MMTYVSPERIQIAVTRLSDLSITDSGDHRLSREDIEWLCAVFPGAREESYMVLPPTGGLGMLLPRTRVVLSVPRFIWGTIQSVVSIIGLYQMRGDTLNQSLVGVGLGNALRDILMSFDRLVELEGEYCTFSALIDAQLTKFGLSSAPCSTARVWELHERHRQKCPITSCRFHEGQCRLSEAQLEEVLTRMVTRGLVKHIDGKWDRVL